MAWTTGSESSHSWQHMRTLAPPLSFSCWQQSCCRRSSCSGTFAPTFFSRSGCTWQQRKAQANDSLYKSTLVRRAAHLRGSLASVRPELCKVDLHNLLLLLQEPFLDFWQSDPSARAYAMGGIIGLLTQLQRRGLAGPAADVSRNVRLCCISPLCAFACTNEAVAVAVPAVSCSFHQ